MREYKVGPTHREFILQMVAEESQNGAEIVRRLKSKRVAKRNGFEPVSVSRVTVWKIVRTFSDEQILSKRKKIMTRLFAITPLTEKMPRIRYLIRLLNEVESDKNISVKESVMLRRGVIRDIREEIGEDVEKIADALRTSSGTVHFHMTKTLMLEIAGIMQEEAAILQDPQRNAEGIDASTH